MILIVTNEYDESTFKVINYIIGNNFQYIVINKLGELCLDIDPQDFSKGTITLNEDKYKISDISALWCRKIPQLDLGKSDNTLNSKVISDFYHREYYVILKFLINGLISIGVRSIGEKYFFNEINKLEVLSCAKAHNLLIPKTFVSSNRLELTNFINKNSSTICKPLSNGITFNWNNRKRKVLTTRILLKDVVEFQIPSIYQEEISKKLEIRSVYILGEFFSTMILSQSDKQFSVDYRNYSIDKQALELPYNLDSETCTNLLNLLKNFDLKLCTIDLILDKTGKMYFLEINPNGQFGNVEETCNVSICNKISDYLCLKN